MANKLRHTQRKNHSVIEYDNIAKDNKETYEKDIEIDSPNEPFYLKFYEGNLNSDNLEYISSLLKAKETEKTTKKTPNKTKKKERNVSEKKDLGEEKKTLKQININSNNNINNNFTIRNSSEKINKSESKSMVRYKDVQEVEDFAEEKIAKNKNNINDEFLNFLDHNLDYFAKSAKKGIVNSSRKKLQKENDKKIEKYEQKIKELSNQKKSFISEINYLKSKDEENQKQIKFQQNEIKKLKEIVKKTSFKLKYTQEALAKEKIESENSLLALKKVLFT